MNPEIRITLATLESKLHEVNSIKSGVKIYESGKIEVQAQQETRQYFVSAEDRSGECGSMVRFSRDGCELDHFFCNCGAARDGALCKHIVAGILAIQGGLPESQIVLGKTAAVETVVTEHSTAKAVGSGSLEVFATPMLIALMERAACEVLADGLDAGQTSVGANITVDHTAATPVGMRVTATATITFVSGRTITFGVSASDDRKRNAYSRHCWRRTLSEKSKRQAGGGGLVWWTPLWNPRTSQTYRL